MQSLSDEQKSALKSLIDRHRAPMMWFLRADYYPQTREEALDVLATMAKRADRATWVEIQTLRRWL